MFCKIEFCNKYVASSESKKWSNIVAMWVMHALPVKVFHCPPFAVVCEGERENPAISEVRQVIWLSDTKNVGMADIHRQIVELYGEGSRTKKGMRGNGAGFSKKTEQMCITRNEVSARTVQVGNFWSSCMQSWLSTRWLSHVPPPQEIFCKPESEKWPRDGRRCARLAGRLGGEPFRQWRASAVSTIWRVP